MKAGVFPDVRDSVCFRAGTRIEIVAAEPGKGDIPFSAKHGIELAGEHLRIDGGEWSTGNKERIGKFPA
jgi:hypothetical protein